MSENDNAPVQRRAYTVTELSKAWGCTRGEIMAAIRDGRLKAFVLGKRTHRIPVEEVARFEREANARAKDSAA